MKITLCIIATVCLLGPACGTDHPGMAQNEGYNSGKARQERQLYRDRAQAKLRQLDAQIDALKAQMQKKTKTEQKEYAPQIAELDRRRAIANEKLDELKNSSQEAWADMKVGIDAALDNLEAACKQAASRFK